MCKYRVIFDVSGRHVTNINANSEEEAEEIARNEFDMNNVELEIDDVRVED